MKKTNILEYKKLPTQGNDPTPTEKFIFLALIVAIIITIVWYVNRLTEIL